MTRLSNIRHFAAAAVVVCLSLLVPFLSSTGAVAGVAGSVTARAAQSGLDVRPGDARFPVGSADFQTAQRVATEFWGGATPCKGQVTVAWEILDQGTNATASWRNPTDAWNNAGENFDCAVTLNVRADFDFPKLCTVMAHELGHLLGKPHADQSGQLMSSLYTDALPACEQAGPAGDEAVAAESVAAAPKRALAAKTKPAARKGKSRGAAKRCLSRYAGAGKTARSKRCGRPARASKRALRSRA